MNYGSKPLPIYSCLVQTTMLLPTHLVLTPTWIRHLLPILLLPVRRSHLPYEGPVSYVVEVGTSYKGRH